MRCALWVLLLLLARALALAETTHQQPTMMEEMQAYWGDASTGYVVSGCLPAPSGDATLTMPACRAYVLEPSGARALHYVQVAAQALPIPGPPAWLALLLRWSVAQTPPGLTCAPGQHYCWQTLTDATTMPAQPNGTLLLARVSGSGGALTTVEDLRYGHPTSGGTVINVLDPIYGVDATGQTNTVAGLNAACAAARRVPGVQTAGTTIVVPPGRYYLPNGGWICDLDENTLLTGYGAYVFSDTHHTQPLIDINPDGSCPGPWVTACLNPLRHVQVKGFLFDNTAAAPKAASVGMKAYALRQVTIQDTYFRGFWTALQVAIQDNFRLLNNRFLCIGGGFCVHQPDFSVQGIPSSAILMDGNIFSTDSTASAAVALRSIKFAALWFTHNTFAGEANYQILLWQNDPLQNGPSEVIHVTHNHFEQGPVSGNYVALLRGNSPYGYGSVSVMYNRMGAPVDGHVDVLAQDTTNLTVEGNSLTAPGPGITNTHLKLRGAATDVRICHNSEETNYLTLDTSEMTTEKGEISYCGAEVLFALGSVITGYNLDVMSDTVATIDMSTAWSSFPATAIPPRAYMLAVSLSDSASAGCPSQDCVVVVKRDGTYPADRTDIRCAVNGLPNNFERQCIGLVPADVNGDIFVDVKASGTNTITVTIRVQAYFR